MAKPILRDRSRYAGVDVLKLRLLAAVGGVSVSVACAGRSLNHDDGGGSSGNGGSSAVSGKAGKGGAGGTGGSVGGATSLGGAGGDYPLMGGKGGTTGGVGGSTGGVGGSLGGTGGTMGGTAGMAGEPSTLGCAPAGEYAPGFDYCTGSYVHRSVPRACEQSPRSARGADENGGAAGVPGGGVADPPVQCADDFDCKDAPNGHCVVASPAPFTVGPVCIYSCAMDDECGAGSICACSPGTNYKGVLDPGPVWLGICMTAGCRTDADCPDSLCVAATADVCGPHVPGPFHCQVPEDECSGPGDCSANATSGFMCSPSGTHYICTSAMCGRPFLVGGAIRQSELTVTTAWLDQALASEASHELDADSQQAIAAHWSQAGLMEHASIAAFARFSLQLMALGAPAELVAAATAAMADETRHAKLCFGLAARYAERPVGPGPLDVSGALGAVTLLEVVELVVGEGCIGETAAALEASWAAAAASDPLVRGVLAGIAEDEARHAELAYRFVTWAAEHDARVLARVKRTLRDALAADECEKGAAPAGATGEAVLEAHGVLSAASRRAARSAALCEILPSLVARLEALAESEPEALRNDRSEAPRQPTLGER